MAYLSNEHIYLFTSEYNKSECLISAHGGYRRAHTTIQKWLDGVDEIIFYNPADSVLSDPGLTLMKNGFKREEVWNKNTPALKRINYVLTKYQDSERNLKWYDKAAHNFFGAKNTGNETYSKIEKKIADESAYIAAGSKTARTMNVLTIRNRHGTNPAVNLQTAIEYAKQLCPELRTFHCSFCRSLIGEKNPPVHKPGLEM